MRSQNQFIHHWRILHLFWRNLLVTLNNWFSKIELNQTGNPNMSQTILITGASSGIGNSYLKD